MAFSRFGCHHMTQSVAFGPPLAGAAEERSFGQEAILEELTIYSRTII